MYQYPNRKTDILVNACLQLYKCGSIVVAALHWCGNPAIHWEFCVISYSCIAWVVLGHCVWVQLTTLLWLVMWAPLISVAWNAISYHLLSYEYSCAFVTMLVRRSWRFATTLPLMYPMRKSQLIWWSTGIKHHYIIYLPASWQWRQKEPAQFWSQVDAKKTVTHNNFYCRSSRKRSACTAFLREKETLIFT